MISIVRRTPNSANGEDRKVTKDGDGSLNEMLEDEREGISLRRCCCW